MLFMRNIKLSRLQFLINRGVHRLLKINTEFKRNSLLMKQDTRTEADGIRCIHCCSATNNFYKFVRKPRDVEKSKESLSHSHLKELLQNCKCVSQQQDAFYSYANLSAEDVAMRECARGELEALLRAHFPSCSLHLIGSSVSGLGLKGCDMDVSFQTNEKSLNCSVAKESVVMSKEIDEGKVPVSAFPSLNSKQKLRFLGKLLKESEVIGKIIPGHFPILSFNYKGLGVDLSVDNISGLHGTHLMRLCAKLDPRVAPLFRLVSYWAKHHKLCGGPLRFKSYGLFLLVVYFLQTRRPAVLPTVEYTLDKTEFHKNQGNWLYDICKYTYRIEKSQNVQSIEELLREFFFFYAYFDFSYVICPGRCELVKGSDCAALGNTDFELNSISIQDPLKLSWNVTAGVSWKYCRHFTKELLYTCEAYQDESRWYPDHAGSWGILSFFERQPSFEAIQKKRVTVQIPIPTRNREADVEEKVFSIFRQGLDFQCKSVDENELLLLKLNKSTTGGDKYSEENGGYGTLLSRILYTTSDTWFGRSNFQIGTANFDSHISTTGPSKLKSEVATTDPFRLQSQVLATNRNNFESQVLATNRNNFESQVRRTDQCNFESDDKSSNLDLDVCTADSSNFKLLVGSQHSFLDAERKISEKLSASREGNKKDEFTFICECRFDGQCLNVIMDPVSSDIFMPKLAIFLKDYIPKTINEIV